MIPDDRLRVLLHEHDHAPAKADPAFLEQLFETLERERAGARSARFLPWRMQALARISAAAWPVFVLALIAAVAIGALVVVGFHRRLPPPFGIAKPGLIAFDANGHLAVAGPDGTGRHVLMATGAIDLGPVFSGDGTRVAFWRQPLSTSLIASLHVANADGSNDIVVSGGEVQQLGRDPERIHGYGASSSGGAGAVAPADGPPPVSWSPDSRRIAYAASDGKANAIFVVDADGKERRQVTDDRVNRFDPSWSPDGTRLVYRAGDGPEHGIHVVDVDGTDDIRLSTAPGDSGAFWAPRWSPDGRFVVYYDGGIGTDHDIAVAAADGSGERILTASPPGLVSLTNVDQYGDDLWPVFSNDGTQVAFKRDSGGGRYEVVVLQSGGGWMTDPVSLRVLDTRGITGSYLTWAPDDSTLLSQASNSTLALIDPTGRAPQRTIETFQTGDASRTGAPYGTSWQRLALDH